MFRFPGAAPPLLRSVFRKEAWLWLACMAGGLALAGSISAAAWLALSDGPLRPPHSVEILIPPGTAAAIQRGEPVSAIPRNLRLVEGDTLVIQNQDVVAHQIGTYGVSPGTALRVPLAKASSATLLCSFHPQGSIGLDVTPHTSLLLVLWPTLIIGIPLGLVSGGVLAVTRRLDVAEAAEAQTAL